MEKITIDKKEYDELIKLKMNNLKIKEYRKNYYSNRYKNEPDFKKKKLDANKKYLNRKKNII